MLLHPSRSLDIDLFDSVNIFVLKSGDKDITEQCSVLLLS